MTGSSFKIDIWEIYKKKARHLVGFFFAKNHKKTPRLRRLRALFTLRPHEWDDGCCLVDRFAKLIIVGRQTNEVQKYGEKTGIRYSISTLF